MYVSAGKKGVGTERDGLALETDQNLDPPRRRGMVDEHRIHPRSEHAHSTRPFRHDLWRGVNIRILYKTDNYLTYLGGPTFVEAQSSSFCRCPALACSRGRFCRYGDAICTKPFQRRVHRLWHLVGNSCQVRIRVFVIPKMIVVGGTFLDKCLVVRKVGSVEWDQIIALQM